MVEYRAFSSAFPSFAPVVETMAIPPAATLGTVNPAVTAAEPTLSLSASASSSPPSAASIVKPRKRLKPPPLPPQESSHASVAPPPPSSPPPRPRASSSSTSSNLAPPPLSSQSPPSPSSRPPGLPATTTSATAPAPASLTSASSSLVDARKGTSTPSDGNSPPPVGHGSATDCRVGSDDAAAHTTLASSRERGKRKKANRACFHCQKAHLTCDDARPCARCQKRGLGDTCADGVRKKAKYLRDYEDALLVKPPAAPTSTTTATTAAPVTQRSRPRVLNSGGASFLDTLSRDHDKASLAAIAQPLVPPAVPPPPLSQAPSTTTMTASEPQFSFTTLAQDSPFSPDPNSSMSLAAAVTSPPLGSAGLAHISNLGPSSHPGMTPTTGAFDSLSLFASQGDFGSEAAGYEYAILSSMLNGAGYTLDQLNATVAVESVFRSDPQDESPFVSSSESGCTPSATTHTSVMGPGRSSQQQAQQGPAGPLSSPLSNGYNSIGNRDPLPTTRLSRHKSTSPLPPSHTAPTVAGTATVTGGTTHARNSSQDGSAAFVSSATAAGGQPRPSAQTQSQPQALMTPEQVYRNVTQPYRYTDSYHFLIQHLKERFEKDDILRIVRALAIYRPSLIALQMPLTEEDEVFIEKCFQRTLIELDRLISYSGTPTVVWRRTGEISCVGEEFYLLTEWTREQLLGKKKFIYELFDTSSTVEYYEAFAAHAFENTTQAVMTTCVLLTPRGRPVPCTCCFTIKRDLFNCPALVIGSFLPILGG